ncbi:hypothetical protein M2418_004254 [Rhizobium sp. BIGb0125]|jgi:hypothetical protein|nr:hypothetical protein [Rhizobium sp. BIGb0125]
MGKLHKAIALNLITIGLILVGWLGYELAGPIEILVFTPLGAMLGLVLSILNWRLLYFLR